MNIVPKPAPLEIKHEPWKEITCDFVGPFPDGTHLFTAVDHGSGFMIAKKVSRPSATYAFDYFMDIYSILPKTDTVHADNAFSVWKKPLRKLGIVGGSLEDYQD